MKLALTAWESVLLAFHTNPSTHIAGPWVIDNIDLYRDLRTGTQHLGIWASRVSQRVKVRIW